MQPTIAISRRLRSTPWTTRLQEQGVKGFTVYNRMLLPTEFESVEADYWHLCEHVQVWDVGAERQVEITGPDADKLVQWMSPRDISKVVTGRCVYLPIVDELGKLLNDPVGLKLGDNHWWLSVADSDVWLWAKGLARGANFNVKIREPDVWPLAIQGPKAETLMERVFSKAVNDIKFFKFAKLPFNGHEFIVARSGWSKQGGFEVYVDNAAVGQALYDELFQQGKDLNVRPGCPNLIERMESGLLSFGNDMDFTHSPLEAGLEMFITLDADIDSLSLTALRAERDAKPRRQLVGLALAAPDGEQRIKEWPFTAQVSDFTHGDGFGNTNFIGSQVWSPRYQHQLATAIVDSKFLGGNTISVEMVDGTHRDATICDIPFDFAALNIKSTI